MPQNIELKVRVHSLSAMKKIADKIGARYIATVRQKDTYYAVPDGTLKLREAAGKTPELIYYRCTEFKGGRSSEYLIAPLANSKQMHSLLSAILGERTMVVQKERTLYLYENVRIHLDRVNDLGTFLEFEAMLLHGKQQARILLDRLRAEFGIQLSDILAVSYSDLLQEKK
jgi:predicted adenylyl cyclase CyaB